MQLPVIAIIGGGFSGAAVAYNLAVAEVAASIVVFEPRKLLGAGLAYADPDPTHRINVPAKRMSLLPDDPEHFARWIEETDALADDPAAWVGEHAFPARLLFGRYVEAALRPFVQSGRILHVRSEVQIVERDGGGWRVVAADGEVRWADFVVIASTHPRPTPPKPLEELRGDPLLIEDGLATDALGLLGVEERVFIVGSGLTAADIVATLDARGHRGAITMISRRGLRSRGHARVSLPSEGDFRTSPARSAVRLLADVRAAVRRAVAEGRSWHSVIEGVREQGQPIWQALEPGARRQVVRHLRPYWDVHRFRIAPQVERIIDRKIAEGSLELLKARLGSLRKLDGALSISLVDAQGQLVAIRNADRIIVATGPAHTDVLRQQSYLAGLAARGAVALDDVGLGLKSSLEGQAIGASGTVDPTLFLVGPLARGAFGELMGVSHVTAHARLIAERLVEAVARNSNGRRLRQNTTEPIAAAC